MNKDEFQGGIRYVGGKMEKAVGDVAEVLLPTGHTVNYKVLGITHAAN